MGDKITDKSEQDISVNNTLEKERKYVESLLLFKKINDILNDTKLTHKIVDSVWNICGDCFDSERPCYCCQDISYD